MTSDQPGVLGVQKMTCVKYAGDPPAEGAYKVPEEIIVMGDGLPTQHYYPERDGLSQAEVLRLLDHSAA